MNESIIPKDRAVVLKPAVSVWSTDNPSMRPRFLGHGNSGEATLWINSESSLSEVIPGLGKWKAPTPHTTEVVLCTGEFAPNESWIAKNLPKLATVIVRKVPREAKEIAGYDNEYSRIDETTSNLVMERAALLRLHNVFSSSDRVRPVRLVGYGMATRINDQFPDTELPYLLLEYVQPRFIRLYEYLNKRGGTLPFSEALSITSGLAGALEKIHKAGVTHGDLRGFGEMVDALVNCMYDPKTKEMRIIDFGNAGIKKIAYGRDFSHDRYGVTDLLLQLTTGKTMIDAAIAYGKEIGRQVDYNNQVEVNSFLEHAYGKISDNIRPMLIDITIKTMGNGYNTGGDMYNTEGTRRLAQDLKRVQRVVRQSHEN